MKTKEIEISSRGSGIREALAATEELASSANLGKKETLRLRLLAEELFGMIRGITGEAEALYWAEDTLRWMEKTELRFSLHMAVDTEMNKEMRRQLLGVSTTGENAAVKGFMSRLMDVISTALSPRDAETADLLAVGMMNLGSTGSTADCIWSMQRYKDEVLALGDRDDARETWDELEKSIVAKLADEVRVYIRSGRVELVIDKSF